MAHQLLSSELYALIDAKCNAFERAWESSAPMVLEAFLKGVPQAALPRLVRELVLLDIDLRRRRGQNPSIEEYAGQVPQHLEVVRDIFATCLASRPPRDGAKDVAVGATVDYRSQATPQTGTLDVRCPSCCTPIEVAVDTQLTDLTCTACGSHFSLVDQSQTTRLAPSLSRMGRFELIERLGIGGFGTVWKARDKELDRTVAVKVPRNGAMSADEQEKFFREARAAAQLRHPNIVSVHEVGRDGDSIYIVSDFVRGITLSDWLTGQRLTNREAAELSAKVAEALHHAHERGIIHRDLKPANIMIDGDGEPHLMDFGLARRDAGEVTVTVDGQILGTPAYMSPEQARGEAHSADRRSDIYSLGVVLYQLLTNELPFRGNARMLMHQVIHDEPPSPRRLNGSVSRDLEIITLKCLQKAPEKRYPTALEFAGDLRRTARGDPICARPVPKWERALHWAKRRPAVVALLALGVATLILSVGANILIAQERNRKAAALNERTAALAKSERDAEAARRANYNLTLLRVSQIWNESPGHALTMLTDVNRCPERFRDFTWRFLYHLCKRDRRTLAGQNGPMRFVAYSPDGNLLASSGRDGIVRIWDSLTGKVVKSLFGHTALVDCVAWSPDSSLLASAGWDNKVRLWNVESGALVSSFPQQNRVASVAFAPDGEHLVSGGDDLTVTVWNVAERKAEFTIRGVNSRVTAVDYSPDGKEIASGSDDGMVRLWDASTGAELHSLHDSQVSSRASELAFSPDGKRLASTYFSGEIVVWDLASRERALTLHGPGWATHVEYSHDGKTLATTGFDAIVKVWDATTGTQISAYRGHNDCIESLSYSADDSEISSASLDGTIKQWALGANPIGSFAEWVQRKAVDGALGEPQPYIELGIVSGRPICLAFSADGKYLAVPNTRSVELWNLSSGEVQQEWPCGAEPVALAFQAGKLSGVCSNGAYFVWNAVSGKQVRRIPLPYRFITAAFAPSSAEASDVEMAQPNLIGGGASNRIAGFGRVAVFDGETGKEQVVRTVLADQVQRLAVSPDGMIVVAGDVDGRYTFWNLRDFSERGRHLVHSNWITSLAFSPDGQTLASGSYDRSIAVWDVAQERLINTLRGHTNAVTALAATSDGETLASAGFEGTVNLWDLRTGDQRASFPLGQAVTSLAFSRDGTMLAVAGMNQSTKIFYTGITGPDVEPAVAAVEKRAGQPVD